MTDSARIPADPLQSPVWEAMAENHLSGHPIVFDDNILVGLPPVTEDQTQVPITIDARKLGIVDEVVVIGDLAPFPLTMKVRPKKTPAYFGFRMRIEQGTVIRAAALKDGTWHVGARYLDAAGGGCSAPPVAEAKVDWDKIGQMRAKIWRESADTLRLRLHIIHPMDTGLQKQPAFYLDTLAIKDANGAALADLDLRQPIAQNPTFTLLFADPKAGDHIAVSAHDSDGGTYTAKVLLVRMAQMTPAKPIREGRL